MAKNTNIKDEFVKKIELNILRGNWKPGMILPPLRELAEQMGVSGSVVTSGISELRSKGYLKTIPRKWTEVADWKNEGTLAVLNGAMENSIYDEDLLNSVLDCRLSLESDAISKVAVQRTEDDIKEFERTTEFIKNSDDLDEITKYDFHFHTGIAKVSQNHIYCMILNAFKSSVFLLVKMYYQNEGAKEYATKWQAKVIDAVKRQDVDDARFALKMLLDYGKETVMKNV